MSPGKKRTSQSKGRKPSPVFLTLLSRFAQAESRPDGSVESVEFWNHQSDSHTQSNDILNHWRIAIYYVIIQFILEIYSSRYSFHSVKHGGGFLPVSHGWGERATSQYSATQRDSTWHGAPYFPTETTRSTLANVVDDIWKQKKRRARCNWWIGPQNHQNQSHRAPLGCDCCAGEKRASHRHMWQQAKNI